MKETFGSTCHGAGRVQSRSAAKRSISGAEVAYELAARGITLKVASLASVAEEAPAAYKDVAEVVHVTDATGISPRVAKAKPIGVIKG